MNGRLLVLGGIRSGKSEYAAARAVAAGGDAVAFVATARACDAEFADRVARHRAARPPGWVTVEAAADLAGGIASAPLDRLVLVDSLGQWVGSAVFEGADVTAAWSDVEAALRSRRSGWVVVTDEVGLAMVPLTPAGRSFVDALGWVNQRAAELADEVIVVIAARPLRLNPA